MITAATTAAVARVRQTVAVLEAEPFTGFPPANEALSELSRTLRGLSREELNVVFGSQLNPGDLMRFVAAEAKYRHFVGSLAQPVPPPALGESIGRLDVGDFLRLVDAYQGASLLVPAFEALGGEKQKQWQQRRNPDWHAAIVDVAERFAKDAPPEQRAQAARQLAQVVDNDVCYSSTHEAWWGLSQLVTKCGDARGVATALLTASLQNDPELFDATLRAILPYIDPVLQAATQPYDAVKVLAREPLGWPPLPEPPESRRHAVSGDRLGTSQGADPTPLLRFLSALERFELPKRGPASRLPYAELAEPLGGSFRAAVYATERLWKRKYAGHDTNEVEAANDPNVRAIIDQLAAVMTGNSCQNAPALVHSLRTAERVKGLTLAQYARYVGLRPEQMLWILHEAPAALSASSAFPAHPWLRPGGYFEPFMRCLNGGHAPGDPRRLDYQMEHPPGSFAGSPEEGSRADTNGALAAYAAGSLARSHPGAVTSLRHSNTLYRSGGWREVIIYGREFGGDLTKRRTSYLAKWLSDKYGAEFKAGTKTFLRGLTERLPLIGDTVNSIIKGGSADYVVRQIAASTKTVNEAERALLPWSVELEASQVATLEELAASSSTFRARLRELGIDPSSPDGYRELKKRYDAVAGESNKAAAYFGGAVPDKTR